MVLRFAFCALRLISLNNISKTYKLDGVEIPALKNINLDINEGDFKAIMGPSGSGKSTLMNLIGLLDKPTSGTIFFKHKDVSKINSDKLAELRNSTVGFVFQQFNLLKKVSALENVILPLIYKKGKIGSKNEVGIKALSKVELEDRAYHRPNQLSGGQQQRVAIARALINNPKLILADEPTGNLDTRTGKQIMKLLVDLNKAGRTVVVITHEKHIAEYAKKVVNILDGEIK